MKKRLAVILISMLAFTGIKSQALDSLTVHYFDNYPYAYTLENTLKGIEVDIINEYVAWLKQKKNINIVVTYKGFKDFGAFYASVNEGSPKTIGIGSVTRNAEREKEVLFSPPYLHNVAVLITDGSVPTIRTKTPEEVSKVLGGLNAIVVGKSSHVAYINDIKKSYVPGMKISETANQTIVLDRIANGKNNFGYVDIVAYWAYIRNNPSKFLKIQKAFSETKETLGFIMPKKSIYASYIDEFFESGFGFTSTKMYQQILEKYLGYEIIESVEIK
jgi:putative glutamine transport system substrate-binding protein